jgi:hypothetical protein
MRTFRQALLGGVSQALRHWRVLLPLYGISLLLGLLQTWPLWQAASGGALRNPFLNNLAGGGTDAVIDLLLGNGMMAVAAQTGLWIAAALSLSIVFGLAYTFFAGGMLSVYAGTRSFWAGCRDTFWSFAGLGLLIVTLSLLALLVGALFGALGGVIAGVIVTLMLLQVVNVLGEYARAAAITHERRNPFVLLGLAILFCARKFGGVLGFLLLGLLLAAALAALYGGLARVLGGSVVLVIVQQFVVLGWIGLKALRLAWALSYVQAAREALAQ